MKQIKWGVLGTAYIFERDTFRGMSLAENCQLYAIAGRSPEKAQAFREKYGFQVAYDSYQALLDDPEVEAVYNPLPNPLHAEWTIKALEKGKHVLCEKPLAATEEEAKAMFRAAEENGVVLMEAFAYQHSPYLNALEAELASGVIGDVLCMNVHFLTSDYEGSNIRMRKDMLGGSMYDIGVYASSLILRLLGTDPSRIQAVASMDENGIDKLTSVLLDYPEGKKAAFTTGMAMARERNKSADSFEIQGTLGTIRSEKFSFNGCGELSYWVLPFDAEPVRKTVQVPNNYMLEVAQLGRCITDGEAPAVGKRFSLANARLTDAVLKEIGY